MKKIIFCFVIMSLITITGITATAQETTELENSAELAASVTASGACGDNLTWTLYDNGEIYIAGKNEMYDYTSLTGYAPPPWTNYTENITKVVFEDGVTYIGNYAFSGCQNITSVDFAHVSSIGSNAFAGCYSLTSVDLTNVDIIGDSAFRNCSSLLFLDTKGVSHIGSHSFHSCTGLTTVIISENTKYIDSMAFGYCSNLRKVSVFSIDVVYNNILETFGSCHSELILYGYKNSTTFAHSQKFNIPFVSKPDRVIIQHTGLCGDNITWVLQSDGTLVICGDGEIYNYNKSSQPWYTYRTNIKKVIIEGNITSVGEYTFYSCNNISSVDLGEVSHIGNSAFYKCSALKTIDLSNIYSLGNASFYLCTNLKTIDLSSIRSLGKNTFNSCTSLVSVLLPESLNEIGAASFSNCSNLEKVEVYNKSIIYNGAVFPKHEGFTLYGYYVSTTKDHALTASIHFIPFENKNIINSGTCGDDLTWSFYDNGELVINGSGAMYDYDSSSANPWFSYRTNIIKLTIGNDVTTIGDYAFTSCKWLDFVDLVNVSSIGFAAFNSCEFESINLSNASFIDDYAFGSNYKLKTIIISNSSKTISGDAFRGCDGIETIIVYNKDITLYPVHFYYTDLTNLTFYGYTGSTAEELAENYGSTFIPFTETKVELSGIGIKRNENFSPNPASIATLQFKKDGTTVLTLVEDSGNMASQLGATISLAPGEYDVLIQKNGYISKTVKATVTNDGITFEEFTLIPGDIKGSYDDICGDGKIDIDDYIRVLRGLNSNATSELSATVDVNEDGNVNVTDIGFVKANLGKTSE